MIGGPATALAELRMARELATPVPIGLPPILLPVDYASHCYGVAELASELGEGGAFSSTPSTRCHSFPTASATGSSCSPSSRRAVRAHDGWAELDHPAVLAKRLTRLEASGRHPMYGDVEIPDQLQLWPAHWLAASGIDLRDREHARRDPHDRGARRRGGRGSRHRPDSRRGNPSRRKRGWRACRGRRRQLASRRLVSGRHEPLCPVHRTRFEFEVTIDSPVGAPPDLDSPHEQATRHALAGDLESAQAAVLDLLGELTGIAPQRSLATSGRSTESPDKAPHVAWRACRGGLPSTRSTPRTRFAAVQSAARILWYVLTTTGSATLTGLAVFFNFLPAVIAAFFGGVVDRLGFRGQHRRRSRELGGGCCDSASPRDRRDRALAADGARLPRRAADAPGATARAALLPDAVELTGRADERASGIRGAIQQGAQLLGAPVGGILVATVGATAALIDAASFLVSAALVAFLIPRARRGESEQRGRFWEELGEGLRFIRGSALVRAPSSQWCCSNLFEALAWSS